MIPNLKLKPCHIYNFEAWWYSSNYFQKLHFWTFPNSHLFFLNMIWQGYFPGWLERCLSVICMQTDPKTSNNRSIPLTGNGIEHHQRSAWHLCDKQYSFDHKKSTAHLTSAHELLLLKFEKRLIEHGVITYLTNFPVWVYPITTYSNFQLTF